MNGLDAGYDVALEICLIEFENNAPTHKGIQKHKILATPPRCKQGTDRAAAHYTGGDVSAFSCSLSSQTAYPTP
jgi:hypothetical protein